MMIDSTTVSGQLYIYNLPFSSVVVRSYTNGTSGCGETNRLKKLKSLKRIDAINKPPATHPHTRKISANINFKNSHTVRFCPPELSVCVSEIGSTVTSVDGCS